MLWKCCTQYASKFGKLSSGHRTGKRSVFIPIPKKGNAKECSNYCTIALISHASKAMLKILQARLQQCMNCELPEMFKLDLERQRNQGSNCQHPLDHRKSKKVPEKYLSALLIMPKPLCGSQQTGKLFKRWEYQTIWPDSWETYMQVRKQQLELDMEQ